jgi:hypothetical protein
VFSNVSPGAAYAHDPDGWGHVYHRAGSFGPGRVPVADPLAVSLDVAGDRAMTERFVAEVLPRRAPLSVLWLGEPDHIQHEVGVGHPEMLRVLAEADRNAGLVMDALAGDAEALLVVASDHGHETVVGVVDVDAALVAAGLKEGPDSGDVVTVSNGTSCLVYLHPAQAGRRAALGAFLAAQDWAGQVLEGDALAAVGQSHANGLAFAVAMRSSDAVNEHGVPGSALVARARNLGADAVPARPRARLRARRGAAGGDERGGHCADRAGPSRPAGERHGWAGVAGAGLNRPARLIRGGGGAARPAARARRRAGRAWPVPACRWRSCR